MSETMTLRDTSSHLSFVKNDILLLSTLSPEIERDLSNRNVQFKIVKYIIGYRDRYIDTLSSPYIIKNLRYNINDEKIIYDSIHITANDTKKLISELKEEYGMRVSHEIRPFETTLMMVLRFFLMQYNKSKKAEDEEILNYVCAYYAYFVYIRIYKKYFETYPPTEELMRICIEKMNYKFALKTLGSVDKMIRSIMDTAITTYTDIIIRGRDTDIMYVMNQIRTRFNNMMRNIRHIFDYVTRHNEISLVNKTFDDSTPDNEGAQGMLSEVYSYANNAATKFFSSGIDAKNISYCAKVSGVSSKELRTVIQIIQKDGDVKDIKEFYEAVFFIYFKNGGKANDIKSLKFIASMDNTFKKGNSIDKNIIKIKTLLDKWLIKGSAVYRATNREATMNSFRRAVYIYLIKLASK